MSTYKLYYFNGRGRAEIARLIFAAAGQQYEDIRFESDQWPSYKPKMPLGQVPVLEYNGVQLPQSQTIARFLAQQLQLAGKDNFEKAKADSVVATVEDLFVKFVPSRREQDKAKKEELTKKFFAEELPKHFQNLEILAKSFSNDGPFFVGNNLTWADLVVYDIVDVLLQLDENCLDNYSWLKQNRAEVEKQPRIAEYLKNRPKTPF